MIVTLYYPFMQRKKTIMTVFCQKGSSNMQICFEFTFLDLNQILADAYCCHAARPSNITSFYWNAH